MKRIALRFPSWAKLGFATSLLLSLSTGLGWFILNRWGELEGEFGPEKHPWIAPLSKAHGAAAFIALISFGMILSAHVPVGWRAGWSRRSGLLLVFSIGISVVSAWALYYVGSDQLRPMITWLHLASGLSLPLLIALHVWSGLRHHQR
jgi:hypothetical protein